MNHKILIFDKKINSNRRHPDYSLYSFVESLSDDASIDLDGSVIKAIFIHRTDYYNGSFEKLEKFLEQTNTPTIFFTGDEVGDYNKRDPILKHKIEISTNLIRKNMVLFLENFKKNNVINISILINGLSEKVQPIENTFNPICFTLEDTIKNENVIKISKNNHGYIDYLMTVSELKSIEPSCYFKINATYIERYDGIQLAKYIRMSTFVGEISRNTIVIIGEIDLKIIEDELDITNINRYNIRTDDGDIYQIDSSIQDIFLSKIQFSKLDISHDRANLWGAFRLWYGYNTLFGNEFDVAIWLDLKPEMFSQDYYWKLFAQFYLNEQLEENCDDLQLIQQENETATIIRDWKYFVGQSNSILYVDDELDKGWDVAFKNLIENTTASKTRLNCYNLNENDKIESNQKNLISKILNEINNHAYNLILLDIRLTENDKSLESYLDLNNLDDLTGIKLLKEIKEKFPNLPVIMITASNKSWMYQEIKQRGADGYWVKESPDWGINKYFTIQNCSTLLKLVTEINIKYNKYNKIWQLYKKCCFIENNDEYLNKFVTNQNTKTEVLKIFKNIGYRIKSAYSSLIHTPTSHRKEIFGYSPEEIAFLYLWSCQNDIPSLRLRRVINKGAKKKGFRSNDLSDLSKLKPTNFELHLLKLNDEVIKIANIDRNNNNFKVNSYENIAQYNISTKITKNKKNEWGKLKESQVSELLLNINGSKQLADDLDRLRKDVRNRLTLTHGNVPNNTVPTNHQILKMVDIINKLIK
ncbi:response regulator [archaeon]|jgi:CheY-like chemotaxis protein|nr:response regulator [archaeon]